MAKKYVDQCFPKPKTTSSNVCPQPKNNQFTVIEEERNKEIVTFKKLVSNNSYFFSLKSAQNDYMSGYYFNS